MKTAQHIKLIPLNELKCHPKNPRRGRADLVAESIRLNGWYGTLVVQKSTNHVLVGNHRLQALCWIRDLYSNPKELAKSQWPAKSPLPFDLNVAPCWIRSVDDDEALRILLSDNRASDFASYDEESLYDSLAHLDSTQLGIDGTLFDEDYLNVMRDVFLNPNLSSPDTKLKSDFMDGPQQDTDDEIQVRWILTCNMMESQNVESSLEEVLKEYPGIKLERK